METSSRTEIQSKHFSSSYAIFLRSAGSIFRICCHNMSQMISLFDECAALAHTTHGVGIRKTETSFCTSTKYNVCGLNFALCLVSFLCKIKHEHKLSFCQHIRLALTFTQSRWIPAVRTSKSGAQVDVPWCWMSKVSLWKWIECQTQIKWQLLQATWALPTHNIALSCSAFFNRRTIWMQSKNHAVTWTIPKT